MLAWHLECAGTTAGVRQVLQDFQPDLTEHRVCVDRARAILLAELDRVTSNGVTVEAEGDSHRLRKFVVTDLDLALDAAAASPRAAPYPVLPAAHASEAGLDLLAFAKGELSQPALRDNGAAVRAATSTKIRRPLEH